MKGPQFLRPGGARLLLFGGKGGVGKTTCALATALHRARAHPADPLLLVSTDPAHSLADGLAGEAPPPNLRLEELDAAAGLAAFRAAHGDQLHEIARRGTFLDDRDIDRFLALSLPGLDELMAVLAIGRRVAEDRYRTVLVDTAPTGHTLRLLALPSAMRRWLDLLDTLLAKHRYMKEVFQGRYTPDEPDRFILDLAAEITALDQLLRDPERCRFVPVTLAETLVLEETIDLARALHAGGIATPELVVNRLYPDSRCLTCTAARTGQQGCLARYAAALREIGHPWGIPMQPAEPRGGAALTALWDEATPIEHPPDSPATSPPPPERVSQQATPDTRIEVEAPSPAPGPDQRLWLFGGKGGVGKTTLACATGLHLAATAPHRRILLFSSDPAHSLGDCLALPVGPEPTQIRRNLAAMEVDAQGELAAMRSAYGEELEGFFAALSPNLDFTFDRRVMEQMLDFAPPGIDEIAALTRALVLLRQGDYDLFVLDAAPSGHLIRLLELPELIDDWLRAMFELLLKYKETLRIPRFAQRLVRLSRDLKFLRGLLDNPDQAGLALVAIPAALALEESRELVDACNRAGLEPRHLFLNLLTPRGACSLCAAQAERDKNLVAAFAAAFPAVPRTRLYRGAPPRGPAALTTLGGALYGVGD
ncbi:MAG: TRC40/GET3/ArsA family transport-energizing ATPase [Candidatus Thiosymbion ectosymbiont of Robbea hypermnestra]|nr:TRC40/GET3/ArsA family transport-energizing ATPase [Candidatus Thiosymbion ectosymbiont of Robbea hypermnestra]